MTATINEIDRINPLDLKAQGEGEMHILHKEPLVRVKAFISDPHGAYTEEETNMMMFGYKTAAEARAAAVQERDRVAAEKLKPHFLQRLTAWLRAHHEG